MPGKTRDRRAAGRALGTTFSGHDVIDEVIAAALADAGEARDRHVAGAADEVRPTGADPLDPSDARERDFEDDLNDDFEDAGAPAHEPADTGDAAAALARAASHARRAAAEAALSLRALVDAAALASTGRKARASGAWMARIAEGLDALAASLGGEQPADATLLAAISAAIDAEIERWEARSADDPEARAVLRAWLGLRELLWELGVRRQRRAPHPADEAMRDEDRRRPPRSADSPPRARRTGRRVQRVPVER